MERRVRSVSVVFSDCLFVSLFDCSELFLFFVFHFF